MSDRYTRPPAEPREIEHGCSAFGHLASPHVDSELGGAEGERFVTHLPACAACRRLIDEYRALDTAWRTPVPEVSDHEWQRAWRGIEAQLASDRSRAREAAGLPFLRRLERGTPGRWRIVQPLAAAAAAVLLVVVLAGVQREAITDPEGDAPVETAAATSGADPDSSVSSVACKDAGWMPVVWTSGGDEPVTVVQCVPMSTET